MEWLPPPSGYACAFCDSPASLMAGAYPACRNHQGSEMVEVDDSSSRRSNSSSNSSSSSNSNSSSSSSSNDVIDLGMQSTPPSLRRGPVTPHTHTHTPRADCDCDGDGDGDHRRRRRRPRSGSSSSLLARSSLSPEGGAVPDVPAPSRADLSHGSNDPVSIDGDPEPAKSNNSSSSGSSSGSSSSSSSSSRRSTGADAAAGICRAKFTMSPTKRTKRRRISEPPALAGSASAAAPEEGGGEGAGRGGGSSRPEVSVVAGWGRSGGGDYLIDSVYPGEGLATVGAETERATPVAALDAPDGSPPVEVIDMTGAGEPLAHGSPFGFGVGDGSGDDVLTLSRSLRRGKRAAAGGGEGDARAASGPKRMSAGSKKGKGSARWKQPEAPCIVCFENGALKSSARCFEGHAMCQSCVTSYVTKTLMPKGTIFWDRIKCGGSSTCGFLFGPSVTGLLPPAVVRKIETTQMDVSHLVAGERDPTSDKWITKNSKSCPNCGVPIQKISGCPHMTCTVCRHEFWYTCNCKFPTHRTHCDRRHG